MPNQSRPGYVFQQIEESADLYGPDVYDLLTFQNKVKTTADSLGNDFIPLTTVLPRSTDDYLPFIIGVLPPQVPVSGRLLDRTGSFGTQLNNPQGAAPEHPQSQAELGPTPPTGATQGPIVSMPGYQVPFTTSDFNPNIPTGGTGVTEPLPTYKQHTPLEVYQLMYNAYLKKFGYPPTATECTIYAAQSLRETSGLWPNNNPGYIRGPGGEGPGDGKFEEVRENAPGHNYYASFNSASSGADHFINTVTRNPNTVASARNGDVLGYFTSLAQQDYYGDTVSNYYGRSRGPLQAVANAVARSGGPSAPDYKGLPGAPDSCAFKESINQYQLRTGNVSGRKPQGDSRRFRGNSIYTESCPLFPGGATFDEIMNQWKQSGSDNAGQASQAISNQAGKNIPAANDLAAAVQGYQTAYWKAIRAEQERMARTPPLKLLVNPVSFKVGEEKIIADSNWGRDGTIVEHWGENQTKLSASGKLAAFYAVDANSSGLGSAGDSPGLTRTARNFSASFSNFMSLYLLYRNNGGLWLEGLTSDFTPTERNNLTLVGSIYIYYDHTLYIGSFDSFTITETAEAPFTLEYSFEFTVRASFLLDQVADPARSYGIQNTIPGYERPNASTNTAATITEPPKLTAEEQAFFDKLFEEQNQRDAAKARQSELRAQDPTLPFGDDPNAFTGGRSPVTVAGEKLFPRTPPNQSKAAEKGLKPRVIDLD